VFNLSEDEKSDFWEKISKIFKYKIDFHLMGENSSALLNGIDTYYNHFTFIPREGGYPPYMYGYQNTSSPTGGG
jgi:hypothetical protein